VKPLSLRRAAAWFSATLAVFLALTSIRVDESWALLSNPLVIDVSLADRTGPRSDPLIVAGESGRGDFLTLRIGEKGEAVLVYDSWGHPGITSRPFRIPEDGRMRLAITMPALDGVKPAPESGEARLEVKLGGEVILAEKVHFYPRDPGRIWFAVNPIGGTACGPVLRGWIRDANTGGEYRGTPSTGYSWPRRLQRNTGLALAWLRKSSGEAAWLLAFSLGLVAAGAFAARKGALTAKTARRAWRHRWFLGTSTVLTVGFAWVVTLGNFRLNEREIFGNFYDYQAASFLQGRLDVPEEAIGGEAFEAKGKLYGYFGPTPALLRLPFVATGLAFGNLSRAAMLLYFGITLACAYLLLREARRFTGETEDNPVPPRAATVILLTATGWGSTVLFLASRGLIFHEAILGGIAFALVSSFCSLRFLRLPESRWWIGALVAGVLSIHTRPPTGLFALTLLGCVAMALAFRKNHPSSARGGAISTGKHLLRYASIGVACAAGTLTLNVLAYAKFGVFDPAPLRISRPYANPERINAIEGKSMHAANVPYGFYTYVIRPNVRLESGFPWIYLGSNTPGHYFPAAKIDLPDHTLAMPYSMPGLFLLATAGCLLAFATVPVLRIPVAVTWLASIPMSLALFAAVATAQRYTGDFCPLLITAAALGLAGVCSLRRAARAIALLLAGLATAAAVAVTWALTLHYQGDTLWGVPEETRANYRELRRVVDEAAARHVR
jgi:hypothetical protein